MAVFANRVRIATATSGTGAITLGSAQTGYLSFQEAGIVDGNQVSYTIEDGTAFEVGHGTYDADTQTLTRTVRRSKVAGEPATTAPLSLSGSAIVFLALLAEDVTALADDIAALEVKEEFDKLGIGGATADATNRLSVNSPAALFNREEDDIQVKVNKEATGDTASFLFQTGFSGRAEIGLVGDDDFQFKVSPDGSSFFTGILIDKDTGAVSFPNTDVQTIAAIDTPANVFQLSGESDKFAGFILRGVGSGSHNGLQNSLYTIEHRPVGSGTNGPGSADYGLTVSIVKDDFTAASPAVGEIDALSLAVRQGGTESDCSAILGNIAHAGTGFSAFAESVTSLIPGPTFTATQTVRTQIGVIDNVVSNSFGYFASADLGTIGEAFRAGTNGGAFTWLFRGQKAGVNVFTVDGDGGITSYRDSTSTNHMATLENDGTGDAILQWLLTATRAWIAGIDNSDNDSFKIGASNNGFASNVFLTITTGGNIISSPPASAPTLANGQMSINLTSDTNLRFTVRGSDGVLRTANLTLAP